MIALLPLFFDPGEPLGEDRALARACARRAAAVLREAVAICGGHCRLVAALPEGADDGPARESHADRILRVHCAAQAPMGGLPPGFEQAMPPLRGLAHELGPTSRTVLCLDPRATLVTSADLARAASRFGAGDHTLLASAKQPDDHPCQGKVLYGALHGFRTLNDRAQTAMENGLLTVTVAAPAAPGPIALELRPPSGMLRVFQDAEAPSGMARFTTPLEAPPPPTTRWRLLAPNIDAPGAVLLPAIPPGAPWHWDAAAGRVVSSQTGRPLAGRQDFPQVLEPDGSFCVASLAHSRDGERGTWPRSVDVIEMPPERAVRVTNRLELLRSRLFARE